MLGLAVMRYDAVLRVCGLDSHLRSLRAFQNGVSPACFSSLINHL